MLLLTALAGSLKTFRHVYELNECIRTCEDPISHCLTMRGINC